MCRKKEIGSEFWDVPVTDHRCSLFPADTQWFVSGRSALQAIIKDLKNCSTAAIPSWCCDSMIKPFADAGMEVRFYPVYFDKSLKQELRFDCDVLFLMDYFGYTGTVPDLTGYKGKVIRDVTHSLFSASYADADYSFGSLRKWLGVWTGGYAWTKDGHGFTGEKTEERAYKALRKKAMLQKAEYINGERSDKDYLGLFEKAEEKLENAGIASASKRDVSTAERLDTEAIFLRRRANAAVLRDALCDWLLFPEMKNSDCPMFVPVLVPGGKRNDLRRYLIRNEIYCPVHWPVSKYHRLDELTESIYINELSIVCDQRYTQDDMQRIVDTIKKFINE